MSVLEAAVLGLVQGLTEFLPISSSGHLVIVPGLLGWQSPPLSFDVLLHAASLLAVLAYFRRELWSMAVGLGRPGPGRRLTGLLVVGTVPAVVVGYLLEERFEQLFGQPRTAAFLLLGTAAILAGTEAYARRRPRPAEGDPPGVEGIAGGLTAGRALLVGCAQALAILPGISRSGSTIGAGLLSGLSRPAAARFSFLLAIPALAGAGVLKLPDLGNLDLGAAPLGIGFLASLVSSYLAIWGLIGYLQRRGLYPFAAYCLVAGPVAAVLLSR